MIEFPPSLPVPDEVLEIARRLEGAGFETWCVGGAVRDNLLKLENRDFDLATSATPDVVQRLFPHTVPIGVDHGTVAVLDRRRRAHEITTFRRDIRTDGRHAVVEFGVSLEEDLARRDFTINAIAYHPLEEPEWRDPFGGRHDLARKVIRAVGDPHARFREDYLRILRALRFAARFDFEIDSATWAAAQAEAPGLEHLSAERVRDEWSRGLESARAPSHLVRLWSEIGALERWLPEVTADAGVGNLDRLVTRDPILMTAYLSAHPAATLTRLRCSNAQIGRARGLAPPRSLPDAGDPLAVRRWMARHGQAVDDLLTVARAENPGESARLDAAVANVRASGDPLALGDLAVTGDDLLRAGLPAGRAMGKTLRALLDAVLEDPSKNDREMLLQMAQTIAAEPGQDAEPEGK